MTVTTQHDRLRRLESGHFWTAGRDRLTDLLMARHSFEDPVLDVGAGTGRFAAKLRHQGRDAISLDRNFAGAHGLQACATQLPLGEATIRSVLARDVMEHTDDKAMIGEICRVLKSGGRALITVPAWPSLWSFRDEVAGHLRRYRKRDLRSLVARHPFNILVVQGYQLALLPAMAASRRWGSKSTAAALRREENVSPLPNRILRWINLAEVELSRTLLRPPTGSSLAIVLEKR